MNTIQVNYPDGSHETWTQRALGGGQYAVVGDDGWNEAGGASREEAVRKATSRWLGRKLKGTPCADMAIKDPEGRTVARLETKGKGDAATTRITTDRHGHVQQDGEEGRKQMLRLWGAMASGAVPPEGMAMAALALVEHGGS